MGAVHTHLGPWWVHQKSARAPDSEFLSLWALGEQQQLILCLGKLSGGGGENETMSC